LGRRAAANAKLDGGQELAETAPSSSSRKSQHASTSDACRPWAARDERQQAVVEPLRQVALHTSQQRFDSGESGTWSGERHTGLFSDGAVGDGREVRWRRRPAGGLDDRLPARRAAGATAVG